MVGSYFVGGYLIVCLYLKLWSWIIKINDVVCWIWGIDECSLESMEGRKGGIWILERGGVGGSKWEKELSSSYVGEVRGMEDYF